MVTIERKWVYDVTTFARWHPGGQIVLGSAAGTDVTMDVFPPPIPPKRDASRMISPRRYPQAPPSSVEEALLRSARAAGSLISTDKAALERERRYHLHSVNAVRKLASHLVGEVAGRRDAYDALEYRRYVITSNTQLTSLSNATNAVHRLRLAVLHPPSYRSTVTLPHILPGTCVEVQILPTAWNPKPISRFYTPIEGDMECFEIIVQVEARGQVSGRLAGGAITHVKVRGPFGDGLTFTKFNPTSPQSVLPEADSPVANDTAMTGWPRRVLFIGAGSGITPFLQMVNAALLPTLVPISVEAEYNPTTVSHLTLAQGDRVAVTRHMNTGFAEGFHLTTGRSGIIPLILTTPPVGRGVQFILIHCVGVLGDAVGSEILEGAEVSIVMNWLMW